jgi:hypothetical protein
MFKGVGAVVMAFILFIGSVYIVLSAYFGRWMGYLVAAASFFGWMIILSSLWLFAFYAQGPETPTNNGPRGQEPAWVPLEGGLDAAPVRYETFSSYPENPWSVPTEGQSASVESVTAAVQGFLAEQANEELGLEETDPDAILSTQFTVPESRIRFAADGDTSLAVAQGFFTGGGPVTTVSLYHDSGSVPRYSFMFLGGSILLFGLHLPLLDRAEKKRKEFLTGGNAPPWYGPA